MNKYLEKIAAFKLPKAVTRYSLGGAKAGVKQNIKDLARQATGSTKTRLGTANEASQRHNRIAQKINEMTKAKHGESVSNIMNDSKVTLAKTLNPKKTAKVLNEGRARLDSTLHRSQKEADSAASRASKTQRAKDLGKKGARKTLAAVAGGATLAGAAGVAAYKVKKKED